MSLERQDFRERPADHSLRDNGERAGSLVNYEPISEDQADCCPYYRRPLEILFVKFRIGGTAILASCANCGIAQADEWRAAESKTLDKRERRREMLGAFGKDRPAWSHSIDDSGMFPRFYSER
jgi:hypothetical protein